MHVFVDKKARRPCLQQSSPRRRRADLRSTHHPPAGRRSSPRCRGHSLIRCARSGSHAHKSGLSSQNERRTDVRPARASGASSEQAKVPRSASTFGVTMPSGSGSRRKRPTAASPPQPPRASTGRSLSSSDTLPFRIGPSPLAGASSAAIAEGIRRGRRQRAQSADGGDVGARQRAWCAWPARVPASSELASRRARSWRPACGPAHTRLGALCGPRLHGWARMHVLSLDCEPGPSVSRQCAERGHRYLWS